MGRIRRTARAEQDLEDLWFFVAQDDPAAADPILLRAGDHVRFRPVERPEYDAIAAEVAAGTWRPRVTISPDARAQGEGRS